MPDKQQIVDSLTAIARRLGRTPSVVEFVGLAEIPKHSLFRVFPRWNEAVRAAGLRPLRLYVRRNERELLEDWGRVVRKKRAVPTRRAYLIVGKHEPVTLVKRFGEWAALPQAFRKFAKGKREWADVVALLRVANREKKRGAKESSARVSPMRWRKAGAKLPHSTGSRNKVRHAEFEDRTTYGNPLDFRGLLHEPVNEQGVVLLFGMVAKELGYMVEAVQTGFPDCEAKRKIAPERWQRVRIEFEFESKKFREHGHVASGCDVIVCWRHNWEGCPEHIEIVELASLIKSLPNSEV
jgi:hypothetical protein